MSFNSIIFQLPSDWVPPFQVVALKLSSCELGPKFPHWLRTQKYVWDLDLSNTSINDTMPDWFGDWIPNMGSLNLSVNYIEGMLPNQMSPPYRYMDLSSNHFWGPFPQMRNGIGELVISEYQFSGPLPSEIFNMDPHIEIFIAGSNKFNGSVFSPIDSTYLVGLDLSNNTLSGEIPPSLGNCTGIRLLDLSRNALSGQMPASFGFMQSIKFLHLNENQLFGKIPDSLRNCRELETIDLGENNFSVQFLLGLVRVIPI